MLGFAWVVWLAVAVPARADFFAIAGALHGADLGRVRAWPNPFKPNAGQADTGLPFSRSNPDSGINFDNLPPGTVIRIYGTAGELIAEHLSPAETGRLQWDARNARGEDVASGAYYAVLGSPGFRSHVKRLIIIR